MNTSGKNLRFIPHIGDSLDSPIQDFEDITAMAAHACGVSSAVLVLKREEKLFMEARCHADACEIDSGDPLWLQTIQNEQVYDVDDINGGTCSRPGLFTSGGKPLCSYAGSSLKDSQGRILGILAVFDTVPHSFSDDHKQVLLCLTRLAAAQMELRSTLSQAQSIQARIMMHQGPLQDQSDSAGIIHYETSAEGNITLCNTPCLQLLGYEETELIGHPYLDFVHPDFRRTVQRFYYGQFLRRTSSTYYELPLIAKNGGVQWLGQNTRLIEEDGRIKGFSIAGRNITERKKFETALREGQQRFQTIVENAAEGIYMTDPATRRALDANTAIAGMLDYSLNEMQGLSIYDLMVDSRENIDQHLENIHRLHMPVRAERQYRTRGGRTVDVEAAVSVVFLDGKETLVTIVHDVTARKKVEAELLASEQRFRDLFRKIPLPAWVCDLVTLKFMEVNDQALKHYGYTREEFLNMRITDIRPHDAMSHMRVAIELIQARQSTEMESQHRCKDGQIIEVETSWHEFHFGGRKALLVVARDITDIKRTQQDAQKAKDAAEKANTAKSEFLSNMSHEIRTPMNGILGTIQLLAQSNLTADQREYLETIKVSGDALLKIINAILDLSRLESGAVEAEVSSLVFDPFIEETYEIVALQAEEKNLELHYWIDDDVPSVILTDATRLRQVLLNLVSNAVKFTKNGGVLVAVTRGAEKSGKMELLFSVKDSGIGIAADQVDRLFKPFSQADSSSSRRYGGAGLGLALSARSVELLGGKIWLESKEGTGSTFRFSVRTGNPVNIPGAPSSADEFLGRRVLFASNNQLQIQIIKRLMASWGCRVDCAETVQRVLECAAKEPVYDCFVLDNAVDGVSSEAVLEDLRKKEKLKQAKAVLLVPHGKHTNGSDAETTILLTKPLRHAELFNALKKHFSAPADKDIQMVQTQEAQKQQAVVSDRRVLVAEDNVINQKLISRILKSLGYASEIASNGKEALSKVQTERYDIVFMDVQMPEMDGYEASRQILHTVPKDRRPVIIAMTAYALQGDRERCLEAGMDDYLSKPILINDVRRCLEKWIEILNGEKR